MSALMTAIAPIIVKNLLKGRPVKFNNNFTFAKNKKMYRMFAVAVVAMLASYGVEAPTIWIERIENTMVVGSWIGTFLYGAGKSEG